MGLLLRLSFSSSDFLELHGPGKVGVQASVAAQETARQSNGVGLLDGEIFFRLSNFLFQKEPSTRNDGRAADSELVARSSESAVGVEGERSGTGVVGDGQASARNAGPDAAAERGPVDVQDRSGGGDKMDLVVEEGARAVGLDRKSVVDGKSAGLGGRRIRRKTE